MFIFIFLMKDLKHPVVIAVIGNPVKNSKEFKVQTYKGVSELLNSTDNIDLIVWTKSPDYDDMVLLRRDARFLLCLIFYTHDPREDRTKELMDGVIQLSDWYATWQEWKHLSSRYSKVATEDGLNDREMLARYLWLRPNYKLSPVLDLTRPRLYIYPLAELISGTVHNVSGWLDQLVSDDLLIADSLVDRMRLCRSCGDGHLNYVDTCPQCGDIDLEPEVAIHCFACGHVAVQNTFVKNGRLSCPNCLTALRHIGVDYDRPLESLRCKVCQAFFVEGEVVAHCLACSHHQKPEDLRIFPISHYRLSKHGQQLVLGRLDKHLDMHLGEEISLKHFHWQTNWCLGLTERNDPSFCLLALRFKGLQNLADEIGEAPAADLIDTLAERFRSVSRSTDLVCRLDDETYLKLLPSTNAMGINPIKKQMISIMDLIEVTGSEHLSLEIHHLALPDERLSGEDSQVLVARLLEVGGT